MDQTPDRRCERRASAQCGLITIEQALAAGLTEHQIEWRLRSGRWRTVCRHVMVINGAPPSWHQGLLAACLSAGPHALASHRSAACLWELEGMAPALLEISVPRKLRREGVLIHRLAKPRANRSSRCGIPVTDPTDTILDLAAVVGEFTLEKALDSALRMRLTHLPLLTERLEARARRGRNGIRKMRRLLEVRDVSEKPHDSGLEVSFARFVRTHGLPRPTPQFVIRSDDGEVVGEFDFAYPAAKVAIELQSYRHHHDRPQWEKDQLRSATLSSIDWLFVPVTDRQMRSDPARLADRLRRILDLRSRD